MGLTVSRISLLHQCSELFFAAMREAASRGCTNHENVAMIAIHSVTSPENFVLLTSHIITISRKAGRFCDSSNTAPCGTAHDEHTSKAKAITGGNLVGD